MLLIYGLFNLFLFFLNVSVIGTSSARVIRIFPPPQIYESPVEKPVATSLARIQSFLDRQI